MFWVNECVITNKFCQSLWPWPFVKSRFHFNPFAPGDFAEKRVLKLVEWFSGHCRAIKS